MDHFAVVVFAALALDLLLNEGLPRRFAGAALGAVDLGTGVLDRVPPLRHRSIVVTDARAVDRRHIWLAEVGPLLGHCRMHPYGVAVAHLGRDHWVWKFVRLVHHVGVDGLAQAEVVEAAVQLLRNGNCYRGLHRRTLNGGLMRGLKSCRLIDGGLEIAWRPKLLLRLRIAGGVLISIYTERIFNAVDLV